MAWKTTNSYLVSLVAALIIACSANPGNQQQSEEMKHAHGQNMPGDTVMTDEDYVEPGEDEFEKVSAEETVSPVKTPDGRVLEDDPRVDEDGTVITEKTTVKVDPELETTDRSPTPSLDVTDRNLEGSGSKASVEPGPTVTPKDVDQDIISDKEAPLVAVYFDEEKANLDTTDLVVLDGAVAVTSIARDIAGEVVLQAGEGTEVRAGAAPSPPRTWGQPRVNALADRTTLD